MNHPAADLTLQVDVTNPGQFFACCGLLELAHRLWPGAEGWFDCPSDSFSLHAPVPPNQDVPRQFIEAIAKCEIVTAMPALDVQRRDELRLMSKKQRQLENLEEEKKRLDALRRESPVLLGSPFRLEIDWFADSEASDTTFKTWAGQQSAIDIAQAMKAAIAASEPASQSAATWFSWSSANVGVPFNFDAVLGGQGSDRDVGFSRDPLQISTASRPLIELLAFVGLQRFRPRRAEQRNRFIYVAWTQPFEPMIASAVACGCVGTGKVNAFEFSLLYRTKYLKSFLPATPLGVP